jgi:hypothetical protein
MAQKRKPRTSPSSGAFDFSGEAESSPAGSNPASTPPDEFDIDLEDYTEKAPQRPKLPEQRQEAPVAEMSGSYSAARDTTLQQPAETFQAGATEPVWQPVSHEEISGFDPHAEVETPHVQKPATTAPARASVGTGMAGVDDLDEFLARTVSGSSGDAEPAKERRPYSMLEKVSISAGGVLVLGLLIWLFRAATSVSSADGNTSSPLPDLPIEGSLVTISEVATSWRRSTAADRVGQMEVILPQPGFRTPEMIPQVQFTIDSSASSAGFVRFIFKDSEGKAQGDTRVVQIVSGKLSDLGKGEIIKSGEEGAVYGSNGLLDSSSYHSYAGSDAPRWSVEVAESADYSAGDKDWKILGSFDVRNDLAP